MNDPIERQAAIDAVDPETVSTNPEHFKLNANEKFIKFMDDADIASFGEWQWENGFNAAVVAAKIQLEKLPSAQPERKRGKWNFIGDQMFECTECGVCYTQNQFHQMRVRITDPEFPNFCPNCGADMRGEQDG